MIERYKEKLSGRTVFVTGADGFIGSHLTDKLVELDADVHVLVRPHSSGAISNIDHLRKKITVHWADLADRHAVQEALKALKGAKKPIVFHLAAQAHVHESWQRPYETISSNVLGTLNLLQSIVDLGLDLRKFDMAGTSEEYGNVREEVRHQHRFDEAGGLIFDERSPINPKSVYATSKVASDFLAMNYFDSYEVPTVVTRMFNNYGPRQNPCYVTGVIITQALVKDKIKLGYVRAKRDFCYVEDGAWGHLDVALYGQPGEYYVYGQGENISILDWFKKIIEVGKKYDFWGEKEVAYEAWRDRLGSTEVEELRVDYSKLNRLSGWHPQHSWDEGLLKTIKWYAENRDKWASRVDWS